MTKQEFKQWLFEVSNMPRYAEIEDAIDFRINTLIAAEIQRHEQGKWRKYPYEIPDHEGDLNKYYLLQFEDGGLEIDTWNGISWNVFSDARHFSWNPIAWQPLPEPYKPEQQ